MGGEWGHTWQAFQELWNSARRHEMPSEGLDHIGAGSDFCFRTVFPTAVQRMWVISGQVGDHRVIQAGEDGLGQEGGGTGGRRGLNSVVLGHRLKVLHRRGRSRALLLGPEHRDRRGAEQPGVCTTPKRARPQPKMVSLAPSTPRVPRPFGGRGQGTVPSHMLSVDPLAPCYCWPVPHSVGV